MRGKRRGQEGRKREREGEVRRRPIEKKKKKTFVSRSRARASLRDETIAPAGRMRREVPKGARGIEKQRARDACVGEAEKESERERSNASLCCLSSLPLLFFFLLVVSFSCSSLRSLDPLSSDPPRAAVALRAYRSNSPRGRDAARALRRHGARGQEGGLGRGEALHDSVVEVFGRRLSCFFWRESFEDDAPLFVENLFGGETDWFLTPFLSLSLLFSSLLKQKPGPPPPPPLCHAERLCDRSCSCSSSST